MTTTTLIAYGETLTIDWDGATWTTSNGSQHSSARDAMRAELVALVRAGGDDPADEEIAAEIETLLDGMDRILPGCRVHGGEGEDYDRGIVDRIEGRMAIVRWDSCAVAECPLELLELL